jgi:hypothetical protein
MGYKMKGFSYPGKSPVKQVNTDLGGITVGQGRSSVQKTEGGATMGELDEYYKELYGDSKEKPTLEDKYTEEGVSKKEGMPEGTEDYLKSQGEGYNIWDDPKMREALTDPVAEEKHEKALETPGLEAGEVPTDKAQIRQQKQISKTAQKTSGKTDEERGFGKLAQRIRGKKEKTTKVGKFMQKIGRKIIGTSAEEKRANRLQKKKSKKQLAGATGQIGVKFNVLSGFKVTPQADKLQGQIGRMEKRVKK